MSLNSFQRTLIGNLNAAAERYPENLADLSRSDDPPRPEEFDRESRLLAELQRQIPFEKLAVFARTYETSDVLASLPIYARANLSIGIKDVDGGDLVRASELLVPLGQISTDYVGYASFDLGPLRDTEALLSIVNRISASIGPDDIQLRIHLWVMPFSDASLAVDALQDGEIGPDFVILRLELDQQRLAGRTLAPPMASMQRPGILDWRLSPSSFASAGPHLVGESGCEQIYPSNLASHQYGFTQLIRRVDTHEPIQSPFIAGFRYGYLMEYRAEWLPVGHSLGQILYSLPLAPGEQIDLAVIDWRRQDSARRTETTDFLEELDHQQGRDRLISEIVDLSVSEHQAGSSFMAGFTGGILAVAGPVFMGGSHALGYSSSSSGGTRHLSADTSQKLSDSFQQNSTALRQLRSTVVTQVTQSEAGRYQTRTVVNHNHCHSLTILYYEVLRHYRVRTGFVRRRPVLIVDFSNQDDFDLSDEAFVLANRSALESALLDGRYLAGFESLFRKQAAAFAFSDAQSSFAAGSAPGPRADWVFPKLLVVFRTGSGNGTDENVFISAGLQDGNTVPLKQVEPPESGTSSMYHLGNPGDHDDFVAGSIDAFVLAPDSQFKWADLRAFYVGLVPTGVGDDSWTVESIRILGLTDDGQAAILFDDTVHQQIHVGQTLPELIAKRPSVPQSQAPPPQLTDYVSASDLSRSAMLLAHLKYHRPYYMAAVVAAGDPVQRGERLRSIPLESGATIFDAIENRPVAAAGFEVAFPLTSFGDRAIRNRFKLAPADEPPIDYTTIDELVAVPTRGVFAEAKLGHCSACEVIDNSRFWDWQKSPIPEQIPSLGTVDTGSRNQTAGNLTPTGFPSSVINIANPPAAPDPVGLANALQVVAQGDLFRDMSGSAILGGLLTSMSKDTMAAVSSLAGSRTDSDLVSQIGAMDELSSAQKADLIGKVVTRSNPESSGSEATEPSSAGTGAVPPLTDGGPPSPGDSSDSAVPKPKVPAPRKPSLPRATVPGKLVVAVSVDFGGEVQGADAVGHLSVHPAGGEQVTGPTQDLSGNELQIAIDKPSSGEGTVGIFLQWDKTYVGADGRPATYTTPSGRVVTAAGGSVGFDAGSLFHAPGGLSSNVLMRARFVFDSVEVQASSHAEAEHEFKVSGIAGIAYKILNLSGTVSDTSSGSGGSADFRKFEVRVVRALTLEQVS
jgi:hypothetical protein